MISEANHARRWSTLTMAVIICAAATLELSCASTHKKQTRAMRRRPPTVIGVLQIRAPEGLARKAVKDLSSLPDLDVRDDARTRADLTAQGVDLDVLLRDPSALTDTVIRGYDFLLMLDKRRGAFTLSSINLRRRTVVHVEHVPFPQAPQDWLESAHNGWLTVTSTPDSALVEVNGREQGLTPAALLSPEDNIQLTVRWTPKYEVVVKVDLTQRGWVHMEAPEGVQESQFAKRYLKSEEKAGGALVAILVIGFIALAVALPFIVQSQQ